MSYAPPEDLSQVEEWAREGCLIPFREEKFHQAQAVVLCSDGKRVHMPQWIMNTFHARLASCDHAHTDPASFRYEAHGLAMRFGHDNPLNRDDLAYHFYEPQFHQAQRFVRNGGIRQLNLVHHWPCGAAREAGITFEESVVWTLLSKSRLKRMGIFPEVSALLWIDIGPDRFEVYRLKLEQFIRFFQKQNKYPNRFHYHNVGISPSLKVA